MRRWPDLRPFSEDPEAWRRLVPDLPARLRCDDAKRLGVTVSATQVRSSGAQLEKVGRLLDDGIVRVVIDSSFPLAEARKAHQRAAKGHVQGKIVLTVD